MKKNNITKMVQLGDITHEKKSLTKVTQANIQKYFIDPIIDNGYELISIVGNHDIPFTNHNNFSSQSILFENVESDQIAIVDDIYNDKTIGISACGWNKDFNQCDQSILTGHFDIIGAEMAKGITAIKGYDVKDFEKFDIVFSGHYHRHSTIKNIVYVGTPLDLSFGENDVDHGFVVLDTLTQEWDFIKTKDKLFHTIVYDGTNKIDDIIPKVKDNFLKVIKLKVGDSEEYENFIKKVEENNPILLKKTNLEVEIKDILESDIDIEDSENLLVVMKKYIEKMNIEDNSIKKENLQQLLVKLYKESLL